jgi:hypothetical protein
MQQVCPQDGALLVPTITTLCGCTDWVEAFFSTFNWGAGVLGSSPATANAYDFKLDQWGVEPRAPTESWTQYSKVSVYVCVCVCVRERERERESIYSNWISGVWNLAPPLSHGHSTPE